MGVDALVTIGIALSVGLIAVSATLNYRMGYRSADTEIDGIIYGSGAGLADGIKAISPFMGAWGWRNGDYLAVACAAVLFTVLTSYSFTAALGFAAQHRANKTSGIARDIERHGDLRRQLDRDDKRLAALGQQRSSAEVSKEMEAKLQSPVGKSTVGKVSDNCTLNRLATRAACADVATLGEELARTQERERLEAEEHELRKELDGLTNGTASSDDAQVDAVRQLADLTRREVKKENVVFGLSMLLALLVELGSGLGLYVVTTPWRAKDPPPPPTQVTPRGRSMKQSKDATGLGMIDTYVLQRLEPAQATLGFRELYQDYQAWCRWRSVVPFIEKEFARQFDELAREVGMPCLTDRKGRVYQNVKLIGR
ncbi:conserved membrane hypothetical protein [Hyphomicrobium sp. GJ21]|uniref:hypothetical protein n=1 Tax=Hyphomicrobium sp. GJ21 TaxID=113574 RepID=UPI000622C2E0|nr:hypothetical protein [Hyphomicrobium sp. GJ21]CEJ87874.1 conserved membrane hypothetical protein [Hyphomicrobium sp. GJ21]